MVGSDGEARSTDTIPTRIRKLSVLPQPAVPIITFNDSLKVFMDKFSIWQLVARIDLSGNLCDIKDERDWMQIFCKDEFQR